MAIASVNGIDIRYELSGDGPSTIVLVNGLADDLDAWGFQIDDFLAAGHRVLRFDNRGVGQSSAPAGPYTSRLLADDTKALVDHLGLTGFHLMGVSMGGMIAQEYALAYGDDLASATFACTYASPGPFCSRIISLWHDMAVAKGVPFVMRDVLLWAFTVGFFEERPEEAAGFEAELSAITMPLDAYLAQLAVIRLHDTTSRIGALTMPTLVLAGEEDILIPVRLSQALHALIPNAQWTTVPGGHACVWERPTEFNRAYVDFVARH
jgi:3-oxoadipate enol-lactonase